MAEAMPGHLAGMGCLSGDDSISFTQGEMAPPMQRVAGFSFYFLVISVQHIFSFLSTPCLFPVWSKDASASISVHAPLFSPLSFCSWPWMGASLDYTEFVAG